MKKRWVSILLILGLLMLNGCGRTGESSATNMMEEEGRTVAPGGEMKNEDLEVDESVENPGETESEEAELVIPPEEYSLIFVEESDGTDDGLERLIASMAEQGLYFYQTEAMSMGLFGSGDVVLLEINCQWAQRGGTNTDLIDRAVEALLNHPDGFQGEIVISDNGQAQYGTNGTGGSLDWDQSNAKDTTQSVMDVIRRYQDEGIRISGYLWDDITKTQVEEYSRGDYTDGYIVYDEILDTGMEIAYPKFTTEYGTYISFKEGIWLEDEERFNADGLKVINMPVLKAHSIYYVTGAVKAYMGVTSDYLTGHRAHNTVGNGSMGALMAGTRMPTLNLMDMIWVGADQGPRTTYQTAVEVNRIAAGTDPVALDYWASKYILMPEAEKLPGGRAASMNPEGMTPGTFGYWLRLSMEEIKKAGYWVTMDEERMLVYGENFQ